MKKSPAQTRHSLLASATVAPRSTAASAGFSPAAPLTAAITQSAGRAAASMMALSPAPHSMPVPASASRSSPSSDGIGDRREARAEFLGELRQPVDIGVRGQRLDLIALAARPAANPSCCRRSSRWRRARSRCARRIAAALLLRKGTALMFSPNHKTAADAIQRRPAETPKSAARTTAATKPSSRSSSPPWPGNDVTGILDAEPALHRGFEEIAELGNNRENRRKQQQRRQFSESERGKAGRHRQARQQSRRSRPPRSSSG